MVQELREKFQLDPIKPTGVLALTASLDLRSCGLTYLLNESCQTILKQELLQQLSKLETSGSSTDESEQPPSENNTKDKGYALQWRI